MLSTIIIKKNKCLLLLSILVCAFNSINSMEIIPHKPSTTIKKQYPCNKCPKVLTTERGFKQHQERQHAAIKKSYQCNECPKILLTPEGLRSHKKNIHSAIKQYYQCDECPQTCTTTKGFRAHKAKHLGTKNYPHKLHYEQFIINNLSLHNITNPSINDANNILLKSFMATTGSTMDIENNTSIKSSFDDNNHLPSDWIDNL